MITVEHRGDVVQMQARWPPYPGLSDINHCRRTTLREYFASEQEKQPNNPLRPFRDRLVLTGLRSLPCDLVRMWISHTMPDYLCERYSFRDTKQCFRSSNEFSEAGRRHASLD